MAVQTLFGQVPRFNRAEFQRKLKRPRFVAPILHIILFATMVLAASKPNAFDVRGPIAAISFFTLLGVDFPLSFVAFSMMWSSAEADITASDAPYLVGWFVLGTLWWFLLGLAIEAFLGRTKAMQDPVEG